MHLNDNSRFCVLTNLEVTCSPNSLSIRHYGFILVSLLMIQYFGVTTFHLFSVFTMCSPDWYMSISSWYNTKCMERFSHKRMIIFHCHILCQQQLLTMVGFLMFFLQLAESLSYRVLLELCLS